MGLFFEIFLQLYLESESFILLLYITVCNNLAFLACGFTQDNSLKIPGNVSFRQMVLSTVNQYLSLILKNS